MYSLHHSVEAFFPSADNVSLCDHTEHATQKQFGTSEALQ